MPGFFHAARRRAFWATTLFLTLAVPQVGATAPLQRLLVLDFEIADSSGEPMDHRQEHARRLLLVRDAMAKGLAANKIYEVADSAPVREEMDRVLARQFLWTCNGCELTLAQNVGADFVMLGKFNKISTLVGSMEILIKDARTGRPVYAQTFGFRGDTDEAWLRAANFFVNRFGKEGRE